MATRPGAVPLTAAGIAAFLVGAFALLTGGQRAQTLGLTAHGDMVVAADGGAADVVIATRLAAGSNGYVLRSIGGTPTWRELSSSGTLASRPACAAGREGQEYWATDGATGLQRTRCVHQGAGTYAWTYVAYDVTAAGSAIARTDVSAAPDGGVLTIAGGSPQWATPSATQPTSLASQARAETLRRRGPLALRSTGSSGTASTGATSDATPDIALSTSGVVVVYAAQAGGYSGQVLAQSGVWATRGWYLTAQGSAVRLNLMQGTLITVDLDGVVGATGWHAVAWSLPADGLTVRYSVDGAAVTTATPSTTPLTAVSRAAGDTVYVATNGAGSGTTCGIAYLALWESILADGDLVTLSTAPSAGAPTLPSSPAWEWAACAFAGVEAVTLDGVVHAITGTPQVWMP